MVVEEVLLDKIGATSRLAKSFDGFGDHYKYTCLKRIKKNMDIIEKKIEKLGGLDKALEKIGTKQRLVRDGLKTIRTLLDANRDLMEQGQIEEEARKQRRKPKPVIATELDTQGRARSGHENTKEYESMYAAQKELGVNPGQIKMCCEGTNHVKTAFSKKKGKRYNFKYVR